MKRCALLLILLAGCGSTADNGAVPSANATVVLEHPQARTLDPGVSVFEVSGDDEDGQPTFGPQRVARAARVSVSVPTSTTSLHVDYLNGGQRVASYSKTVDLSAAQNTTLTPSPVVAEANAFSFVFFGCNRVSRKDVDKDQAANVPQLSQDFSEIPALNAQLVFETGDLVENEETGHKTLEKELTAWLSLFGTPPFPFVACTGNHEVLIQDKAGVEYPNPETYPVWQSLMAPFIAGSNGPTTSTVIGNLTNPDNVYSDLEARLSYTFTRGNIFFMVLNTDTFLQQDGALSNTTGAIPLVWAGAQLSQAQADPNVAHIFVLGHKPIVSPDADDPGIQASQAAPFYALLNANSKVRAYLCAHAHRWQLTPSDVIGSGHVPQVIAGNGGSELEGSFKHPYFGYTLINVAASGTVSLTSYGRKVPSPYNGKETHSTKIRDQVTL